MLSFAKAGLLVAAAMVGLIRSGANLTTVAFCFATRVSWGRRLGNAATKSSRMALRRAARSVGDSGACGVLPPPTGGCGTVLVIAKPHEYAVVFNPPTPWQH